LVNKHDKILADNMEGTGRLLHTAELHEHRRDNHEDRLIFCPSAISPAGQPCGR
jgi:hypothetical protein